MKTLFYKKITALFLGLSLIFVVGWRNPSAWDTVQRFLATANTWTAVQTFTSLVATTADINAGTVDATIGGTTPAAGNFTSIDVTKDAADADIDVSAYHDTEATTPKLIMRKADGTEAAPALVDDDAVLGTISFQGYDGSGFHEGAKIEARVDGTPSDGTDMPGELSFWTTPDGSATIAQRMTIDDAGKVGIGTTSPGNFLHIYDATANTMMKVESGDEKAGLSFTDDTATMQISSTDGDFRVDILDTGTYEFIVDATGKVGINTIAPQSLLDVQGPVGTGATGAGKLTLATKELTIVANDELGRINFNAPLESSGTDAILPGASIWAVAEAEFTAAVNSTSLVFATGTSEAAAEAVRIDSAKNIRAVNSAITVGSGTGLTVNTTGHIATQTYKVTTTYDAYSKAATTDSVVIATLPAKMKIISVYADTTTPYTGGAVSAATLEVGITAEGAAEIIAAHDVLSGAVTAGLADADMGTSMTRAAAIQGGYLPNWTGTTAIYATIDTTTANTNALTAGSTTFYIVTEQF